MCDLINCVLIDILSTFQTKQSFVTKPLSLSAAGRSKPTPEKKSKNIDSPPTRPTERSESSGRNALVGGGAHCPLCNLALAQKRTESGVDLIFPVPISNFFVFVVCASSCLVSFRRRRMRGDLNLHANHMFAVEPTTKTTSSRSGSQARVMKTYLA